MITTIYLLYFEMSKGEMSKSVAMAYLWNLVVVQDQDCTGSVLAQAHEIDIPIH